MSPKQNKFINRELSWLEFNDRVLQEARNPETPLLERTSFLAITSSNLDEFFMVRVGSLHMMQQQKITRRDAAGMTPTQQLRAIASRVRRMIDEQSVCFKEELLPEMEAIGIRRLLPDELDAGQKEYLERYFENEVFPVTTPMVLKKGVRMPVLRTGNLYVMARLKMMEEGKATSQYVAIPVPDQFPRMVSLPIKNDFHYIYLEDVMRMFIEYYFRGQTVLETTTIRVTRNADMAVREDVAPDLSAEIEEVLEARKTSDCIRLEIDETATQTMTNGLRRLLDIPEEFVFRVLSPLDFKILFSLGGLEGYDEHRFESWPPQPSPDILPSESIFDSIRRNTLLLHHPYHSYEPVERLVREAADDPDVLAIKQILYRTSNNSSIVKALCDAARNGKNVTVLVELKARFDEALNVVRARELESAGAQVIYGIRGLKTHAKICIVIRRERSGIQRYMHYGTGNYNENTAKLYGDISYMTCDPDLGIDGTSFFNMICGISEPQDFLKIESAPVGLKARLLDLIRAETERSRQGRKAWIMAKVNSLVDRQIIEALYEASSAGVKIELNVRGICCLRAGVKGLSENIRVISIVDRFLEHSRICCFHHGGDNLTFISSADWMPRNLDRRIELLVPIEDKEARKRLLKILRTYFKDTVKARELQADDSYKSPKGGGKSLRAQEALYQVVCQELSEAMAARPTSFQPHRPPS